jgi:hypothetical protein
MNLAQLRRIRSGEVLRVTVRQDAIDATRPLPRHLRGVLLAIDVTDSGFVQCQYVGRSYGPTLHYEALSEAPPLPPPSADEIRRAIREADRD